MSRYVHTPRCTLQRPFGPALQVKQALWAALLRSFQLDRRMEHLTCFVAGNLALGVHAGAVDGARAEAYLSLAKNLTDTCYSMYHTMPTGNASFFSVARTQSAAFSLFLSPCVHLARHACRPMHGS